MDSKQTLVEEEVDVTEKNRSTIEDLCKPFSLTDDDLRNVKDLLLEEMKRGLCKYTHEKADVKCYPTYVQHLPTGCERGNFLALDFNAKNCRVVRIYIEDNTFSTDSQVYEIPEKLKESPGEYLFDQIADYLAKFINSRGLMEETLRLGFTFSFPTKQINLTSGLLMQWTNNIKCEDVINNDVVVFLREAIKRRGDIKIGDIVLLSDITGTLMSCAWENKNTKIGLNIGNGTNSCYIEKVKYIQKFQPSSRMPSIMIINTKWGSFGDNGKLESVRNSYDKELDTKSANPGAQFFEKMVSGEYLGELVRLVIITGIEAGALFEGRISDQVQKPYAFKTKFITEIENKSLESVGEMKDILETLGLRKYTDEDCLNVRYICEQVSARSSNLISAGAACLIDRIGDPYTAVAVEGSIYRKNSLYRERLNKKIRQLARPEYQFDLMLSEDGSGRGAALISAAVARRK